MSVPNKFGFWLRPGSQHELTALQPSLKRLGRNINVHAERYLSFSGNGDLKPALTPGLVSNRFRSQLTASASRRCFFRIAVRGKNTRKFAKHLSSYYVLEACGLHCTRQKAEKHVSNLLKVCGLDPGTLQTAVVVWNGTTILDHQIIPNIKVIDYLTHTDCPVVACEHLQCYGMAVGKEVFETGYWIGRYWQVCDLMEIDWQRVFRSEIKAYWCHSLKAADSNIRAAIIDRLGKPGTKKAPGITYDIHKDLWSALAIAVRAHDLKISVPPP